MPKTLVSGIQPTGAVHIGNYFGALAQWLELQEQYQSYLFIADLHALNQIHDRERLAANIQEAIKTYLAIGLDPEKVVLFRQSEVPAHTELCWILNCITSLGTLERAHAYKDALANSKAPNVGLFDYPVLMAADILLYKPEVVPVGPDQKQHVEIAADLAQRFNHLFGQTFVVPQVLLRRESPIIPGLDGRKMSKSYANTIGLFDAPELIQKKVMSIPTDSSRPEDPKDPENDHIFALHRLFSTDQLPELEQRYHQGGIGYKESKEILLSNINTFLKPIQERYQQLERKPDYLAEVLEAGRKKAALVAEATLAEVKTRVGL